MYIKYNTKTAEINDSRIIPKPEKTIGDWEWRDISDIDVQTALDLRESNKLKVAQSRKTAYESKDITIEAMVVALWERIVEGRAETSTAMQQQRTEVKKKYPKQ